MTPEHEPWRDQGVLRRFEADLYYAESPFDLYNAFVTYMERQFDIPEEAAMKLQWQAQEKGELPDAAAYDVDPAAAHEQTRLALVRIAVPFAESLIEDDETFSAWLYDTSLTAMGTGSSVHEVGSCILSSGGDTGLGCEHGDVCPVRTVKYLLILDAMSPDYESPDYADDWGVRKVQRTIAKLDVALRLGLSVPEETKALRKNYVFRSKTRGIVIPDESDI